MSKDANINIKLEVSKDKTSGKLSITAHFNDTAPNIIKENDTYYWIPTIEERDFLTEAFNIFPNQNQISNKIISPEKTEENPITDTGVNDELTPSTEIKYEPSEKIIKNEEPNNKTDVFEVTGGELDIDETDKNKSDDINNQIDQIDEDNEGIVEADLDAIEEALKKHGKKEQDKIIFNSKL